MLTPGNFASTVWLMQPDALQALYQQSALITDWPSPEQLADARQAQAKQLRRVAGKVAVIPVYGMIEQRMSGYGYLFGGCSTEAIEGQLDGLVNARDVECIILDVDSPGGMVFGIEELAQRIYDARGKKPVYAIANAEACSAAYWIASSAEHFCATPSALVGSVGCYILHLDTSQALEEEGIKCTFIKAGKYKAEGNPFEPLDKDGQDYLQQIVDGTYTKFVKAVARGRGTTVTDVRDNYGKGRVVTAEAALSAKMVDRVCSFSEMMDKLCGGKSSAAVQQASAEVLRLRHECKKMRLDVSAKRPVTA